MRAGVCARMTQRQTLRLGPAVCIAIYLTLSAASAISHDYLRDRVGLDVREGIHTALLAGQAKAPSQYRMLVPVLGDGLQRLGFSFHASIVALRFGFTLLCAALLHVFLRRWYRDEVCLVGVLVLFSMLPLTYIIYQVAFTDPANLAFTIGAMILISRRQDFWLAPLIAISMLNRESLLLIPLIWLLYRWDELPLPRCIVQFTAYCAIAFAAYFALRLHYGPIAHAGAEFFDERGLTPFLHNLTIWRGYGFAAVMFGVPLVLALRNFSTLPKFMQRGLLFCPLFAAFHLFVAVFLEPRLMLPIFPLVLAPALASFVVPRLEPVPPVRTIALLARSPRVAYLSLFCVFIAAAHVIGYRLTHAPPSFVSNPWFN
jgi:hypothetical protein